MGSPSRNVQYHPPRLSEDRLNLPQPHSPSLPTHCSGKSGMRPIVHASWTARERARLKQNEAERTLLDAIGPRDWSPAEPLTYRVPFGRVLGARRIDAQYFMPAKEQVHSALAAIPGQTLGNCVDTVTEPFVPQRAPATMRVRSYDVTDALAPVLDADKKPSAVAEIGSVKKTFKQGDVAVSRLRAYLREIAVVRTGGDIPAIGSSEFHRAATKEASTGPVS